VYDRLKKVAYPYCDLRDKNIRRTPVRKNITVRHCPVENQEDKEIGKQDRMPDDGVQTDRECVDAVESLKPDD